MTVINSDMLSLQEINLSSPWLPGLDRAPQVAGSRMGRSGYNNNNNNNSNKQI